MSISKAQIALIRSLGTSKGRKQTGLVLVETPKVVQEALTSGLKPESLFCLDEMARQYSQLGEAVQVVSQKDLERASNLKTPNGVIGLFQRPEPTSSLQDLVFVLDKINDPGNLGTIIRTADWFGDTSVIMTEGSVDPFSPKVVQASMGSVFRMAPPRMDEVSILDSLSGYEKWATAMDGVSLTSAKRPEKLAVFMGNEANGLHPDLASRCDAQVTIPGKGQAESLNVAMATGILMSHLSH